jgi:D-serine deaminase-like pyridoxal phosphate-dependent protein
MSVETVNALLVIADIGGYTRFMSLHRTSLAHAQENTLLLLDAIIDAAPDLELSGLEGDAAFLYATDPSAQEITRSLARSRPPCTAPSTRSRRAWSRCGSAGARAVSRPDG